MDPEADTPWTQRQTPPPRGRHPHPEVKTGLTPPRPRGRQPPPQVETAYEAGGTHPTGCILVLTNNNMFLATIIASINFEIHNHVDFQCTLYFLKYPTTMFNQFCIAVMVDSRVLWGEFRCLDTEIVTRSLKLSKHLSIPTQIKLCPW